MSQDPKKFRAFISYSHSDTKITEWLHKSLETFKVPGSLVGAETKAGIVPKRIFPVFRDRDELPTSADLGENLHMALRNSRYLVVVCSPKSAQSRWVDAEVNYFKMHHGNGNVLCLIVDGKPGGSGEGAEAECFCPSLCHHVGQDGELGEQAEPIAADVRPEADGPSRAFLKIAAGLLGVDFDALYQREKRRRRQRAIIMGVAACLLAGIGFAFYQRLDTVAKSQNEMVSEVKKLKETKFRQFGNLPKERSAELSKMVEDLELEKENVKNAFDTAMESENARFDAFEKSIEEQAEGMLRLRKLLPEHFEFLYPRRELMENSHAKNLLIAARFLATHPDPSKRDPQLALKMARQADIANTGYYAGEIHRHTKLDTLAACHAAVGDFAAATKWQGQAQEVAAMNNLDEQEDIMAKGMKQRLQLYRAGKPYVASQKDMMEYYMYEALGSWGAYDIPDEVHFDLELAMQNVIRQAEPGYGFWKLTYAMDSEIPKYLEHYNHYMSWAKGHEEESVAQYEYDRIGLDILCMKLYDSGDQLLRDRITRFDEKKRALELKLIKAVGSVEDNAGQ